MLAESDKSKEVPKKTAKVATMETPKEDKIEAKPIDDNEASKNDESKEPVAEEESDN